MRYQEIHEKADQAGQEAAHECTPTPMVVQSFGHSPQEYYVSQGVCGFAYVNVKPGTSGFARWLKAQNIASKDSYRGGVTMSVFLYNQSMELKNAYATAYAKILLKEGVHAYSYSMMD